MLQTRVIPCLLLKNNALVKTVKFNKPNYIGDAINTIRIFNQMEVDELIFLDINATNENKKPPFNLIADIASECFMPFSYGGGLRTIEDIKQIFTIGVEKVSINSYAMENPSFIREASDKFGSQSIVVSIDVKKTFRGKYIVYTNSGKKKININPVEYAKKIEKYGAGEILLNSIDKDGTWDGYDIDLLKSITSVVNIPVVSCGGAGKIHHLAEAVSIGGASAVTAGSMFVYQGKDLGVLINYPTRDELKNILI